MGVAVHLRQREEGDDEFLFVCLFVWIECLMNLMK